MWRAFCILIVTAPSLAVLECGGNSGGTPQPRPELGRVPDPPRSADALALASAQCDYLERCDPDAMFAFPENSRAACEEYFACEATPLPWEQRGKAVSLEECIESLRSRECPDFTERPGERFSYTTYFFAWSPACGGPDPDAELAPLPDAAEIGEACLLGNLVREPCQRESHCVPETLPVIGTYFCGICEPLQPVGDTCGEGTQCISDAACVSDVCREIREVGEPCEYAGECRTKRCEDSMCGPRLDSWVPYADVVGRACGEDGRCGNQAGLTCVDGICRPLPNEGERCVVGPATNPFLDPATNPVVVQACRLGHACFDGRCVALGCTIDVGEPCFGFCDGGKCVDGECLPADEIGDSCSVTCANGLRCDLFSHRCAPPAVENGAPCDFDKDCASYFCERDLISECGGSLFGCSITECGKCGVCAEPPTVSVCD